MQKKKWTIGFGVAVLFGLLSAGAGLAAGMDWQAFVAVLCTSLATHLGAYLMKHPVESVDFDGDKPTTPPVGLFLLCGLLSFGAVGVVVTGCSTSQQRIAFNSIATVQTVTVAAYDGYVAQVVAGRIPTNDVPLVSKRFNQFQASSLLALDAVNFNTNALAPESLQVLSKDLLNLIVTITPKK